MIRQGESFSLTQAHALVKDLFQPKPAIYWTDFLVTTVIGMTCFTLTRLAWERLTEPMWLRWLAITILFVVTALAFYRAALFIHELVHLRQGEFKTFRIVWNLLIGVPFLMPSFVYYTHIDHHRRKHYGTLQDGEYLQLRRGGRRAILWYFLQVPVIPILAVIRWGILSPIAWVVPGFRRWLHQHASSMIIDPSYVRPLPTKRVRRIILLQEVLCFLWLAFCLIFPLTVLNRWPIPYVIQCYSTALLILSINHLRTLGAHLWSNDGDQMTFMGQLVDSTNVARRPWISALWGPLGLRYHALHHLFPSMPYHSMGEAHRRLMASLPADSPYRKTVRPSLLSVIAELWRVAGKNDARRQSVGQPASMSATN